MSTRLRIAASAVAGSFYVMVAASGAVATEISVVSTAGPMPVVMGALIPIFEQASGNKVTIKFQGVPEIFLELKGGASIDLVIADEDTIGDLVEGREIAGGSRVMVSRVGIAVRAGAPKPNIGSADALSAALVGAKSVAYGQGASGRHFVSVISRLKLVYALRSKSIIVQGKPVGAAVAAGEAEIAVDQVAELLPVPGIDVVGPLPGDLQTTMTYMAGVPATAKNPQVAKALVKFLTSEAAATVLRQKGMDPS
jgi:molybdate transport system substrate-binding protein